MDGIVDRLHPLEGIPDQRHGHVVAMCPEEFLEIHRVHVDDILFRWYQYVLDVLFYGDEGSRLIVIIASVFDQGLDGLPGEREELDLIEHNGALMLVQPGTCELLQVQEEIV
ncbi:MAG: hypothetical protein II933_02695 [Candidatus Methanomethylophilaceae archaeon]|nr:hypothetical protein [Candidatus Methanomethylophilaceae archaeon]